MSRKAEFLLGRKTGLISLECVGIIVCHEISLGRAIGRFLDSLGCEPAGNEFLGQEVRDFRICGLCVIVDVQLAGKAESGVFIEIAIAFHAQEADARLTEQMEALLQADGVAYKKASVGQVAGLAAGRRTAKVLIASENKTFTAEVIRQLNALVKKNVPVEVWCTNRVRGYETSDPDALFNLTVHSSAPYFVDYSDPRDQQFVKQYRALYYAEPDDFAFQGYDVFSFFISSLIKQGTAFLGHAEEYPMQLLHCNFHFVKEDEKSGWRNCATRNLMYEKEGFTISVVK